MKNIILIFIILLSGLPSLAQMPTDGDYSNWNWEDQSPDNWKRYNKDNNLWIYIDPPFALGTERIGDMVGIDVADDYKKELGWELVWAQFNGVYPYFILYNKYRGLIRAFIYNDGTAVDYLLATLSFYDVNSPGILAYGDKYADAPDKYLNGTASSDDMISVVVPFVGVDNWCAADFPIFLDNNILNSKYDSKKWEFKFYSGYEYQISLVGKQGPAETMQHTIAGKKSDVSGNEFSASHAKLHKGLESTNKLLQSMQSSVAKIDTTSPKFLQTYKEKVSGIKKVAEVFNTAVGISSGVGAVLGFLKILSGTFDEEKSSKPVAVLQYMELEGTMKIDLNLGGNTLKIPGVGGTPYPNVDWTYNCPIGYFNMKKTPEIKKTSAYSKYGCYDAATSDGDTWLYYNNGVGYWYNPLLVKSKHPFVSGYSGKIVKYKFDDNIELVYNDIPDLNLVDIHFAIVGASQKDANRNLYYDVEKKVLAYHTFIDRYYYQYNVALENPVYRGLQEGRYIIHKFDKENGDVYFGTPYLPMNKLKGVVLEVPEHTDIKLRVVAKFSSEKYDKPIVFQANYNLNVTDVTADQNEVYFFREQSTFPFSGYYTDDVYYEFSSTKNSTYTAGEIVMKPGFIGEPDYAAIAVDIYPNNGNTIIEPIDFGCETQLKSTRLFEKSFDTDYIGTENIEPQIYPNPSEGLFTINLKEHNEDVTVSVYNMLGSKLFESHYSNVEQINLNLQEFKSGIYLLKINNQEAHYNEQIIIK